jgi:7-cyano-7-deazaguanine tRNA-ribosyltransferase
VLLTEGARHGDYDESWRLVPPFGPVPPELADVYPLTGEVPDRPTRAWREAAADGVAALVEAAPDATVTVAHRGWPAETLNCLPTGVDTVDLTAEPTDSYDGQADEEP